MAIPGLRRLFELAARPFGARTVVDREIDFHLEMTVEGLRREGWSESAARAEAVRRFGDLDHHRETLVAMTERRRRRHARSERLSEAATELSRIVRGLARTPSFTFGVGLVLALGIGMNATMVGLVDRLLFKPPAQVEDPDRVVRYSLSQTFPTFGTFTNTSITWKEVGLVRERVRSLESVAAFAGGDASFGAGDAPRRIPFAAVTSEYFSLLGVRPARGRFFGPGDDPVGGGAAGAVISHRLWEREFGGRMDVIGQPIQIGRLRLTVIGVAPRRFTGIDLSAIDVWLPFHTGATLLVGSSGGWRDTWDWQWVKLVGRLRQGVSRAAASAEATAVYRAAVADHPERKLDRGVATFHPVLAARGAGEGKEARVAAMLAGVSVVLLLVTCANVANLLLARGIARRREIAVRMALGVGRGRIVGLLTGEAAVLAGLGAAGGIALAFGGGWAIRRYFLADIDFVDPPVDARLLAITGLVAVVTAVLIAAAPALRMSRPDLAGELKGGGGTGGRRHHRLRTGLLLVQATLSAVLLVGAGLFARSFERAAAVDFGFRPKGLLVAQADLAEAGVPRDQRPGFFEEALPRVRSLPGVVSASLGSANPFQTRNSAKVRLPGRDSVPRLPTAGPYYSVVTPEYLATLEIPLRDGRGLLPTDQGGAPPVVLVNETMARTFWPGERAVGRCLHVGDQDARCREVVGVVGDANSYSLELRPVMAYYVPAGQDRGLTTDRVVFVRAAGDPAALVEPIRRTLQRGLPSLAVISVRPIVAQIEPLYRPWRLAAALFGAMGLIALLVAMIGLYSGLSYAVVQRRRELGVRAALGATGRDLVGMIVGEAERTVLVAVGAGLGIAAIVGRWVGPHLFRTSPWDPAVLGGVAVVLLGAAAVGSLVPARRAARTPPAETLRVE